MFLLRVGMGGFFLFVAGRKLLHLDQLQATIDRFSIFPEAWGHPLASLGVACEIVVGLGLLFRRTCAGAALLGSALTFTFVALFVQGWIRGLSLSCNCIGVEREVTSYPFEVAWRLGLFALMLVILWNSCRKGKTYFNVTRLDFSEM
jgi:Methylamine utilisation protein MauE.